MKIVSFKNDYNSLDLGDPIRISELIIELEDRYDGEIELDFRGCFIDYPATSVLIDYFIDRMRDMGKRKIVIHTDMQFDEKTLLRLIFLESKFLMRNGANEVVDKILRSFAEENNISIEIKVWDAVGKNIDSYRYE